MINNETKKLELLKTHERYPFDDWNTNIFDYSYLCLFWLSFVKQFGLKNWKYSLSYYVNFDNEDDRDFSTDVIAIKNPAILKSIAICPITNYDRQYSNDTHFVGIFKKEYDSEPEYDILSIEMDLNAEDIFKSLEPLIRYFVSDEYDFEDMETLIEEFNKKYPQESFVYDDDE